MILLPQKVAYRGSVSDLRISSVDGTAFIDNLPSSVTDLVAADPGNHLIEIYSATGMLRGYLSAVGDGEDLGEELLVWTNGSAGYAYETFIKSDPNITQATNSAVAGVASVALGNVEGKLFKLSADLTISGTITNIVSVASAIGAPPSIILYQNLNSSQSISKYWTEIAGATRFLYAGGSGDFEWSTANATLKQATGPSTSGAVIVSTKGGATENFSYKSATFSYNQASYQVIVRKAR